MMSDFKMDQAYRDEFYKMNSIFLMGWNLKDETITDGYFPQLISTLEKTD